MHVHGGCRVGSSSRRLCIGVHRSAFTLSDQWGYRAHVTMRPASMHTARPYRPCYCQAGCTATGARGKREGVSVRCRAGPCQGVVVNRQALTQAFARACRLATFILDAAQQHHHHPHPPSRARPSPPLRASTPPNTRARRRSPSAHSPRHALTGHPPFFHLRAAAIKALSPPAAPAAPLLCPYSSAIAARFVLSRPGCTPITTSRGRPEPRQLHAQHRQHTNHATRHASRHTRTTNTALEIGEGILGTALRRTAASAPVGCRKGAVECPAFSS
jgi:hypothetical protein